MFINVTKFDRFGNVTKTVHVNLDDDFECVVDDPDKTCEDEFDEDELYCPCEDDLCGQMCFDDMMNTRCDADDTGFLSPEEFYAWRQQLLELSNGRLDVVNKDGSLKNPIDILTDFMVVFKDEWTKVIDEMSQPAENCGQKKREPITEEKREAIRKSVLKDLDEFWASGDDSVTIRIEREQ